MEWHKRHPEKSRANRQRNISRVVSLINNLKAGPCTDCGREFPPECMDFDHLDASTKVGRVSTMRGSRLKMLEEVQKCELVCACCHRTRTRTRAEAEQHKRRALTPEEEGAAPSGPATC
jgi:hypothetical protein